MKMDSIHITVITNIDRICRTCLIEHSDRELKLLYENNIDAVLETITAVKVLNGDGLPSYICDNCLECLRTAANFREQCLRSESQLRNAVFTSISEEEVLLGARKEKESHVRKNCPLANQEVYANGKEGNDVIFARENLIHGNYMDADGCSNIEKGSYTKMCRGNVNVADFGNEGYLELKQENVENVSISETNEVAENCVELENKIMDKALKEKGTNIQEDCLNKTTTVLISNDSVKDKPPDNDCTISERTLKQKECSDCGEQFPSANALRTHSKNKHRHSIRCNVCKEEFPLIKQLNAHQRTHDEYKPFTCETPFSLGENLSKPSKEKSVVCKVCGKGFTDRHGLTIHNKIHTGERNYKCNECGKCFAHSFVLKAHKRTHTGEKPYVCSICGLAFATSSYLTIHKRTHTHEKPYKCNSCPKAFVSKSALVAHGLSHSGEKKYQCSVCGQRAARLSELKIHMRTHTGERPYSCDQCDKSYMTSSNLAAHRRTHTGIKNHGCTLCEKVFGDKRTLKSHVRTHTGEKPYACTMCDKRYTQSGQLASHKRTHKN